MNMVKYMQNIATMVKGATVYVRSRFHNGALFVGVYEDMARAKGVLYEVDLAYQTGQRVFYMPAE